MTRHIHLVGDAAPARFIEKALAVYFLPAATRPRPSAVAIYCYYYHARYYLPLSPHALTPPSHRRHATPAADITIRLMTVTSYLCEIDSGLSTVYFYRRDYSAKF